MAIIELPPTSGVPLTVHVTHRPPGAALRNIDQVVGEPRQDVRFRFSRGVLTEFDVDVIFVPETALELLLGTKGAKPYQRLLTTAAFVWNLRRHRIALVRHFSIDTPNAPLNHRASKLADRLLDRATTQFVTSHHETTTPDARRTTVVPHADFRSRFIGYPTRALVPGRILCIDPGYLHKGVRGLLAMAEVARTPGLSLRLAGLASRALTPHIRSAAARYASVSSRIEKLSDGAQVEEITAAELVALTAVESQHDVQMIFLALSLDRPVLTPRNPITTAIAESVGGDWLYLSEGEITAEAIDKALESTRSTARQERPRLAGRELATINQAYADLFRTAASTTRARHSGQR